MMVDFHDPEVLGQDYLTVAKLWHAVAGFYFWEFITTLDYEWSVIQKHRPYRWPIWIYSTTRIATVTSLAIVLYGVDVSTPYDCEVKTILQLSFGYLSIATSSFLIVLRIFTIWNEKKAIVVIATGVLGTNVILLIYGVVRFRVVWDPVMTVCLVVDRHIPELNIFCTLATDIVLLLIMSFGLLRLGIHEHSTASVGHFLWKQGLVWLLIATIVEVLPAVFISLNLNDPFNYMFLPLSMVTFSIAATRIYRSSVDHASVRRNGQLSNPINFRSNDRVEWESWKAKSVPIITAPTLPAHMEVSVNRTYEQEQTLNTSQDGSFVSVEGQSCDKRTRQPGLDGLGYAENDVASPTRVL